MVKLAITGFIATCSHHISLKFIVNISKYLKKTPNIKIKISTHPPQTTTTTKKNQNKIKNLTPQTKKTSKHNQPSNISKLWRQIPLTLFTDVHGERITGGLNQWYPARWGSQSASAMLSAQCHSNGQGRTKTGCTWQEQHWSEDCSCPSLLDHCTTRPQPHASTALRQEQ